MTGARARLVPLASVLGGQLVASATSFATTLALGRWGGEASLGRYALGWSCWFLAMSLGDTLVATPYTYCAAQPRRPAADLPMAAAWSVGGLCAAFAIGLTLLWQWDAVGLAPLWPALPAAVASASLREFVRRHWLVAGRPRRVLWIDVSTSLMQLAGLAVLVASGRLSAVGAFWVMAAAAAFAWLPLCTPVRLARLRAARREALAVAAAFFGYGRWLLLGGVCHVAGVQAYPWLAYAAGGERLAGLWAACNALTNLLSPVLTALTNHFRPRFMMAQAQGPRSEFAGYVLRRVALFAAPALALWLLLHLAGQALLVRLYHPGFAAGAAGLSWLALGTVAVALAAPFQLAMLAMRVPASNLAYHGSALALLALALALAGSAASLSMLTLGQLYAGVNLASCALLVALFLAWRRA